MYIATGTFICLLFKELVKMVQFGLIIFHNMLEHQSNYICISLSQTNYHYGLF